MNGLQNAIVVHLQKNLNYRVIAAALDSEVTECIGKYTKIVSNRLEFEGNCLGRPLDLRWLF